jgi:hypothetical protein
MCGAPPTPGYSNSYYDEEQRWQHRISAYQSSGDQNSGKNEWDSIPIPATTQLDPEETHGKDQSCHDERKR